MKKEIKKRIENLKSEIREHEYNYYVLSQPVISDSEYDLLLSELKKLEIEYPEFKTADSPTQRLSISIQEGFKTVEHKQKMFSLDNTYSFDEIYDWEKRLLKVINDEKFDYMVELKIDGLSANLTYEKGQLVVGATRGDGQQGEDVTANIKTIRSIPLFLRGNDIPDFIEIRGEVYMNKKEFYKLNNERKEKQEILFANPRNAASGSLKLLDTSVTASRNLSFFAHSLGEAEGIKIKDQFNYYKLIKNLGIPINENNKLCSNIKEVIDYCEYWQNKRDSLNYEIDGMVIKVNSIDLQKKLGFTLKSPRWAIAYKFPARQITTVVKKININVGRTGVITPTAELEPKLCGGVVIKNATLHNFEEIQRLSLRENDVVLVERAGDVIPKIVKVIERKGKEDFKVPLNCPVCNSLIIKAKEQEVAFRCVNSLCPAQLEQGLIHFVSRDAMNIEGLGDAIISQLVNLKLVNNFADLYTLKREDLLKLDLVKDKKADNLIKAIEKSKSNGLSRLLFGLGIRHVGQKIASILAEKFSSMDKLIIAKKEDFDSIYEVGSVIAESIINYFKLKSTKDLIFELKKVGVKLEEDIKKLNVSSKFSGKIFIFTGELTKYTREEAQSIVQSLGGKIASGINKKIDFVVVGENAGSKLEKAAQLGLKTISELEFIELIK